MNLRVGISGGAWNNASEPENMQKTEKLETEKPEMTRKEGERLGQRLY